MEEGEKEKIAEKRENRLAEIHTTDTKYTDLAIYMYIHVCDTRRFKKHVCLWVYRGT